MALFFKSVTHSNLDEWGGIGHPRSRSGAPNTGDLRRIQDGDVVLLGMSTVGEKALKGLLFAAAEIDPVVIPSRDVFPREIDDDAFERWPAASPFRRLWRVASPFPYLLVRGFGMISRPARGRLVAIPDAWTEHFSCRLGQTTLDPWYIRSSALPTTS